LDDIKSLDSCSAHLGSRVMAPPISAVYYLLHKDECLYVGKTLNLRNRLRNHEKLIRHRELLEVETIQDIQVAWKGVPPSDLDNAEREAIRTLRPRFNFNLIESAAVARKPIYRGTEVHADLLTTPQAAAELGLSVRTVQDRINRGRVPVKRIGRDWLIKRSDLTLLGTPPPRGRPRKAKKQRKAGSWGTHAFRFL
jgi:excisionase family DNA binding protein